MPIKKQNQVKEEEKKQQIPKGNKKVDFSNVQSKINTYRGKSALKNKVAA